MITTIIFDLSRVLLFPKDKNYKGKLNALHRELSNKPDYDVLKNFGFNDELLSYLDGIKEKVDLYVFTTGIIQDSPEIRKRLTKTFKDIFAAEDLGLNKKYLESYLTIAKKIRKTPNEILFVDDSMENMKAAEKAGFLVIHFENNTQFLKDLSRYVI